MKLPVKKFQILFFILALIIILPLLRGSYLFALDSAPMINQFRLQESFYGKTVPIYGGNLVLYLINNIIPASIFQKLLLFLILILSAYSAQQLISTRSVPARIFAGSLYMLNPYTYIRIIAGHWHILLSYALLPLVLKVFIDLLEKRTRKDIIKLAFLLTVVGFNVHTLMIAFIAMSMIFLFWYWRNRDLRSLKNITMAGIFFILLSAYWIIPLALSDETLINEIGSEDLEVFSPSIDSPSALFTLASMHGFWRPGYVYSTEFIPYCEVLFFFIMFLAVHGFISNYRDEKIGIYVRSIGAIAIIGLILATGIWSPFSDSFRWLFDHTLLKGMRDSHKFVTLLVLAYAYLGALGVWEYEKVLCSSAKRHDKFLAYAVIAMALLTPFVYSFTFFNGFSNQIKPGDYPSDWYVVNGFLNNDSQDFKTLFLPWHQYMNFHWVPNNDKRIINPAQYFFDMELISARNLEIGDIYRQVFSKDQLYIDFLLNNRENITNIGELITPLNIKYVLLAKESDYKKYFFLFNQSDLELLKETENFYVFRNRNEVTKIYEVKSVTYISGWEELINRSRNEDITQSLYLIGNTSNQAPGLPGKMSLQYEMKSPVQYELKENSSTGYTRYTVFTEPYSQSWELDGIKPFDAYGVVNAYKAGGKGIRYETFYRVYLPSYIISILTLIVLIILYLIYNKCINIFIHPYIQERSRPSKEKSTKSLGK